jgi:hypothetical protein
MMAAWVDDIRAHTAAEAAAALGYEVRRDRFGPCPLCSATRERNDKRAPCYVSRGLWGCHACGAAGSVMGLLHARVNGLAPGQRPTPEEALRVKATAAGWGWCEAPTDAPEVRVPRLPPPVARVEAPRPRAPVGEAEALWRAAGPVSGDAEAVAWLRGRVEREGGGADPEAVLSAVVRGDYARVLPRGAAVPPWARCQGAPWSEGWRLILRAWGPGGLVGLRARRIDGQRERKEVSPTGGIAAGALYACARGRRLLAGDRPERWDGRVIVREGGPDWLLTAGDARIAGPDGAPAVLGLWSGAWPADGAGREVAGRLAQAGARVLVATDADEAGDRYAAAVLEALIMAGCGYGRVRA